MSVTMNIVIYSNLEFMSWSFRFCVLYCRFCLFCCNLLATKGEMEIIVCSGEWLWSNSSHDSKNVVNFSWVRWNLQLFTKIVHKKRWVNVFGIFGILICYVCGRCTIECRVAYVKIFKQSVVPCTHWERDSWTAYKYT